MCYQMAKELISTKVRTNMWEINGLILQDFTHMRAPYFCKGATHMRNDLHNWALKEYHVGSLLSEI